MWNCWKPQALKRTPKQEALVKRPKAPKSIKLDFKAINRCLAQYRREDAKKQRTS